MNLCYKFPKSHWHGDFVDSSKCNFCHNHTGLSWFWQTHRKFKHLQLWLARTFQHLLLLIKTSFYRHVTCKKHSGNFPRIACIGGSFNFGSVPTQSVKWFKCTGFRSTRVSLKCTLLIIPLPPVSPAKCQLLD
jgi:hypothetical protein